MILEDQRNFIYFNLKFVKFSELMKEKLRILKLLKSLLNLRNKYMYV